VLVRAAAASDIARVAGLANEAAARSWASFATAPEPVADWERSWESTRAAHPWLVAEDGGAVVGFARTGPYRARGAYAWTAEVSVYVDPAHHGRGVGAALYARLVGLARAQGYVTLLAGIAQPNEPSERLHARFGFVKVGTLSRVGYKFGAYRDVAYWQLSTWPELVAPEPVRPVAEVAAKLDAPCRVQRSTLADVAPLIGALDAELSATYPEPGATHFRLDEAEVDGARGAVFAARLLDEVVGCGAVRLVEDDAAELKRMYVAPRWRGRGVSRALLAAAEGLAKELGATRALLETGERQVAARALYERAGYRAVEPFGEYVGSPYSLCMEKALG
jgi:L-amino acid N-acyltransferase YncA